MSEDKFEWNEDLIAELITEKILSAHDGSGVIKKVIEDFKQSKTKEHKDYEILERKLGSKSFNAALIAGELVWDIIKVKRLSDNEILSVDDITDNGRITGFTIDDRFIGGLSVDFENGIRHSCLKVLKKVKQPQPLFTTEDGVELYDGNEYWWVSVVSGSTWMAHHDFANYGSTKTIYLKLFSTKEKAEEYIILNKPCLSVNDVLNSTGTFISQKPPALVRWSVCENELKKLVKAKKI